jgi:hypothetical protein
VMQRPPEQRSRHKEELGEFSPNKSTINCPSARILADFSSNLFEKPTQKKASIPNQLYLYHVRNQYKAIVKKDQSLMEIEGRVPPVNSDLRSKTPLCDSKRQLHEEVYGLNLSMIEPKSEVENVIIHKRIIKTQQRPRKIPEKRSSVDLTDFKVEGWRQDTDH